MNRWIFEAENSLPCYRKCCYHRKHSKKIILYRCICMKLFLIMKSGAMINPAKKKTDGYVLLQSIAEIGLDEFFYGGFYIYHIILFKKINIGLSRTAQIYKKTPFTTIFPYDPNTISSAKYGESHSSNHPLVLNHNRRQRKNFRVWHLSIRLL